jgi:Grx4 family monothiol glutaredoxin
MSVEQVHSVEELAKIQAERSILFFWASWHEPSKEGGQLQDIFKTLAEKYASIKFIAIEAEAVPDLSETFNVTVVPTFVARVGSAVYERLEGASPPDLSALVKKVAALTSEEVKNIRYDVRTNNAQEDPKKILFQRLEKLVNAAPVMLFMKGSPSQPRCGFSRQITEILTEQKIPFASFDILTDEEVRAGLKEHYEWPTFPQLYVNGNLIGGLDIVKEMVAAGNFREQLDIDKILENYKGDNLLAASSNVAAKQQEEQSKKDSKETLNERLKKLINTAPVMLFMKGTPSQPRCGFSNQIVDILKGQDISFASFDIFTDEEVRAGLKEYSEWPTYPQLYANGNLVGGLDIVKEMVDSGNFKEQIGLNQ